MKVYEITSDLVTRKFKVSEIWKYLDLKLEYPSLELAHVLNLADLVSVNLNTSK